jgi:uncharacterized phage protein (TIGR02220 family)
MYGKIFESIYEGTLAGHWQAIVTMQQLIVLANEDGVVDMTPEAIARRTSIPMDIIAAGLEHLAKPDPHTRTPGEDGRRIVLLDDHRPWGWRLVNHAKYRALRNLEQKREADRGRIAEKRKQIKDVAIASRSVANVAHTDTDTEAEAKRRKGDVGLKPDDTPAGKNGHDLGTTRQLRAKAIEILGFLNEKTGRNYHPVPANVDMIVARLRDGATVDDCRAVIAKKCREWLGDERMNEYLRPATLFNRTKFAQYQGELVVPEGRPH